MPPDACLRSAAASVKECGAVRETPRPTLDRGDSGARVRARLVTIGFVRCTAWLATSLLAACAHLHRESAWPLEGTYWRLAGARDAHLVLDHATQHVTGFDGCNRFTGVYTLADALLRFGPMAATRRACAEDAVAAPAYPGLLARVARWRLEADRLQLIDASGEVLASFASGSERLACEEGRTLLAHYDARDPQDLHDLQPAQAVVSFAGRVHWMHAAPAASGTRYVEAPLGTRAKALEWRTTGDEGVLVEVPVDDARRPGDERTIAKCAKR
jgi:heat shock protein HslJ